MIGDPERRADATVNDLSGSARVVVQARDITGGVHVHPTGDVADFAVTPQVPVPPSAPLAVPHRRVASDRLHGRDAFVAALIEGMRSRANSTDAPRVWALCGLGGTGKTTIALEVAHRLEADHRYTWWVSASDPTGLMAALRAVATDAGAAPVEFDHLHPADVLWRRLDVLPDPWLLVLDNLDDPDTASAAGRATADGTGWLRAPRTPHGTVLVTSRETRRERWGPWVTCHEVDPLAVPDAARVLLDLAPDAGDAREAELLAAELGGLPLALDLAGSYLATTARAVWPDEDEPVTFAAYRAAFAHRLPDVAVDTGGRPNGSEQARRDIFATWELSLDLLVAQGHDIARPLLRLLSCFAETSLPYQLVLDPEVLRADDRFTSLTHRRLRDALQGLAGLRLITISPGEAGRTLDMHPVVRAGIRSGRGADYLFLVTALLERATASLSPDDPGTWSHWSLLASHCTAAVRLLVDTAGASDDQVLTTTALGVRAARHHYTAGYFEESVAVLRSVVSLREQRFGPAHPETLHGRRHHARALLENGQFRTALVEYEHVLELSLPLFDRNDPHLLSARRGLGRALMAVGRFTDAEAVLDDLFRTLVEAGRAEDDPETVASRYLRALVLVNLGKHAEAERELRNLLVPDQGVPGQNALDIRHHIARTLRGQGRIEEAEAELRTAIEASSGTFAPEHLALLAAQYEWARDLRDLGHLDRAERALAAILDVTGDRLREDHPITVATRHERATVLHRRGHYAEALAEFTDVWRVNSDTLGETHPDTLTARHNMACVLLDLEALDESFALFDAVAAARQAVLGAEHPQTEESRWYRARVLDLLTTSPSSTGKNRSDS
ncbi:tetratricopeptide repeat protein [Saccharothrix sp. NRRL B-16348]|uniref:tetratricopeptide repeat protein n=1 Tax=Saccharothrix sp. NRRL B-16348 TaxID=1415542 RepID=UPI0006AF18D0|nr:tetratricopeptide repeat protein [Saccharothrix sp. NRRL B-16348]